MMEEGKSISEQHMNELATSSSREKFQPCQALMKTVRFLLHFVVVMIVLLCGAMAFSALEDFDDLCLTGISPNELSSNKTSSTQKSISHKNISHGNLSATILERLNAKVDAFCYVMSSHHAPEKEDERSSMNNDRLFLLFKWFNFVITSTTTIGYGHTYPKTENGKLFYVFFSIGGIAMTMNLLKSCGAILTSINKKLNCCIRRGFLRDRKLMSSELLDLISLTWMFFVFMLAVLWHDQYIAVTKTWSLTEAVYFWIVTFSTVGLGDFHFSLEEEINHIHLLLFYRMLGLSFMAAIIESIQKYTTSRKTVLVNKSVRCFTKTEASSFNNHEIYTGDVKLKMLLRRQTVDAGANGMLHLQVS